MNLNYILLTKKTYSECWAECHAQICFFTFTFRKYHLGFTVENGNLVAKMSG